mmetsp:Transcript_39428/g.97635  ORF Transcript_39428/g.97635 Transcript_39428/m.97635 type:complete len:261 (-) Transcript_39428:70-852(-)
MRIDTSPVFLSPCAGSMASSLNICWSHPFSAAMRCATRAISSADRAVGRTYRHPTLMVNTSAYKPPAPQPMVVSRMPPNLPWLHSALKPSVWPSMSASRCRCRNGFWTYTRSRSVMSTPVPVAMNLRSRSYLSVLTRLAGCVPSWVEGIFISGRNVGTAGQVVRMYSAVSSSSTAIRRLRTPSRFHVTSRNDSRMLPPFHQHILEFLHIITPLARPSMTSPLSALRVLRMSARSSGSTATSVGIAGSGVSARAPVGSTTA